MIYSRDNLQRLTFEPISNVSNAAYRITHPFTPDQKKEKWTLRPLSCWEVKTKWWIGHEFCTLCLQRTCNYGNVSFKRDDTVRDKRFQLPSIMYFCVWNKRPCANIKERKWVFALGRINIGHFLNVWSNGYAFTIHSFPASFHKDLHLTNNCRKCVENALSRKQSEPSYLYRDIADYLGMLCVYLELHIE